jgi:TPR repeat protein
MCAKTTGLSAARALIDMRRAFGELETVKALGVVLGWLGWLLAGVGLSAQTAGSGPLLNRTLAEEEKHFLECLAYVYSPPLWISYEDEDAAFSAGDFVDLRSLSVRLTKHADPVSNYVWQRLSDAAQETLASYRGAAADAEARQATLAEEFNRIVGGPSIYDAQRFKEVTLRPETRGQLSPNAGREELRRRNRLLLEDAYPLEILRMRSLFFAPKDAGQTAKIEAMLAERSEYVALTNRQRRYELAAQVLGQSGLDASWQRKLLLPYSDANLNLTPTIDKPLVLVAKYQVISPEQEGVLEASRQWFEKDDALLRVGVATYFVMRFGHGADDGSGTNACLLEEGEKRYAASMAQAAATSAIKSGASSPPAEFKTVPAFTSVSLSKEERAVLAQAAAAFRKQAQTLTVALKQEAEKDKAKEEFESYLSMANDDIPSIQFLLGKCYLEGRGTPKDEKRGLDWVRKAASNGSGGAQDYLDALARKGK